MLRYFVTAGPAAVVRESTTITRGVRGRTDVQSERLTQEEWGNVRDDVPVPLVNDVIASCSRLMTVGGSALLLAWTLSSGIAQAQRAAAPPLTVSPQSGPIYPGDAVLVTVSARQ